MTSHDRLLEHVRALAGTIGPRPPASEAEQRAAQYVADQLRALGAEPIREQTFASSIPVGRTSFMLTALMALGLVAGRGNRLTKLLGGASVLTSTYALYRLLQGAPLPFTDVFKPQQSQNLIAHLRPAKRSRQFLFLTANLDSNRGRTMHRQGLPFLRHAAGTALLSLGGLAGVGMLIDSLIGRGKANGAQASATLLSLIGAAALGYDELQPIMPGANGNASGVAVLLGLAEALKQEPLEHTEVVLLFTGAQEASASGINAYLRQFAPPRSDTWWIDVESVGAGELAYVSRGGASAFTSYRPAPRITAMANQIAREHPELRVRPQPLDLMGAAMPLIRGGYEAIAVVGYAGEAEPVPVPARSDDLDTIDAEVMGRAQNYITALMRAIDAH